MRITWLSLCLALEMLAPLHAEDAAKTKFMATMSWYHPLLEPCLADITLLCTVESAEKGGIRYESPYWTVRLRIDERIYVDKAFADRLAKVQFLISEDFRERKAGERIVFFGGIDEKYDGEDFLKPCWSGTNTDLGILLFPKGHDDESQNEALLESLRALAKGGNLDSEVLEHFSDFSPKGVLKYLIREKRLEEYKLEEKEEANKEKEQPQK